MGLARGMLLFGTGLGLASLTQFFTGLSDTKHREEQPLV